MTSKEKEALKDKAAEAVKHITGVEVYIHSYIYFEPTISISPEMVELGTKPVVLAGKEPVRADFPTKEAHQAARKEWRERAMPLAEEAFAAALKCLRKAKIRYRTYRYYGWPKARLA